MPVNTITIAGKEFKIYVPPNPALPIANIEFPKGSKNRGQIITIPGVPNDDFPDAPVGLVEFNYEDVVNAAHFCDFTLEDLDGSLEALVVANRSEVIVKFGYSSEFSQRKRFKIVKFNPAFTGSTVTMSVHCIGMKASSAVLKSDPAEFTNKTHTEIVEEIAPSSWGIREGESSKGFPDKTSTSHGGPGLVARKNSINDLKFIKDFVIPGTEGVNGGSGYVIYLDEDIAPGGGSYYFGPRNYKGQILRTYNNRGPDATVISWSPVLNGDVQLYMGAGKLELSKYDPYITDYADLDNYRFISSIDTVSNKPSLGGDLSESDVNTTRSLQVPFSTKEKLRAYSNSIWHEMRSRVFQSTLITIGDPTIKANSIINVIIARPNGTIHFTSGKWWVQSAKHRITAGTYTTEFQLIRTSMPETKSIISGMEITNK